MTDRNKFEEMLERLVNEDRAGAEELFHEIVVERSREIYENLLAEDEEVEETTDEEVDEAEDKEDDEDDKMDESEDDDLDESDDEDLDEAFFDEMGPEDDAADDMMGDIAMPGADDMAGDDPMAGDDMGMGDDEGEIEDRVMDLEDELEALKAEFEAMMGDEAPADDDADDMDMGSDDDETEMPMDMDSEEGDDDEDDEAEEEAIAFEGKKSQAEMMREYVDTVAPAKMGDNGANTKSAVAGKNDMGGTAANMTRADTSSDPEAGAGKKVSGSALNDQNAKEESAGNVNVPGAKAATKMAAQPGHGAEKKGKPETADKGAGSTIKGN